MCPYRSKIGPVERFAATVIYGPDCWFWRNRPSAGRQCPTTAWYGHQISVNRIAWTVATGTPPPRGLFVCHTCDNPCCVRNDDQGTYEVRGVLLPRWGHLWLGTHVQNMADMVDKGRSMTGDRNPSRTHPEAWLGVPHINHRGEQHGRAKHTETEVLTMRADYARGATLPELMLKYSAPKSTIFSIVSRDSWRHLP